MAKAIIRCSQCDRRMRREVEADGQQWNAVYRLGYVVGHLCPQCQTPEENAEAEVNAALSSSGTLHDWAASTPEENAKAIVRGLYQHTEDVWREWLRGVAASTDAETVELDLDALTEQAWGTLPQQWRDMARTPDAVETGKDTIRDHFEWLIEQSR